MRSARSVEALVGLLGQSNSVTTVRVAVSRLFLTLSSISKGNFIFIFNQTKVRQLGPGMLQQIRASCEKCQGLGELVDPDLRCSNCEGNRVIKGKTIVEVNVVRGMVDDQKIVFDHEGDQASGMESGDVVVVLHEQKHDIFERNFLDLSTVVKVETPT